MELEDYVEKLSKQKKLEKRERKKKEKEERSVVANQYKQLMRYTSSQNVKLSKVGQVHRRKVFRERRKNYYNYPRGVVYLSSIPHGFFEEQMASYFSQFGKVTGIYMPRAPSGKIRGYAFLEFQLEVIAKIVADTMNNYLFYQRILKAKYIPPAEQKPYMFVWPFANTKKKSVRIAKEVECRQKPMSTEKIDSYKRLFEKKMAKKMKGLDYSIQVSGEAPTPRPPSEKKEKITKAKLKKIAAEAAKPLEKKEKKVVSSDPPAVKKLLDEKLALQIKKKIAAKLARPLKKMKKNRSEQSSDSDEDDFHSADDFETADEGSFFEADDNDTFQDTINMDFDDDDSSNDYGDSKIQNYQDNGCKENSGSLVKKSKVAKSGTPKLTSKKSEKNTPKNLTNVKKQKTPRLEIDKKTPKSAPKSRALVDKSASVAVKTPKSAKIFKAVIAEPESVEVKTPKTKHGKVKTPKLGSPNEKSEKPQQKSAKKLKASQESVHMSPLMVKTKKNDWPRYTEH